MNRARGFFDVWQCLRIITAVLYVMGPWAASYAQQKRVGNSAAYYINDGPILGGTSSQLITLPKTENTHATSAGLPESPKRTQPGLPPFDSLRLMSSTSGDEDQPETLPLSASRAR